MIYFLSMILSLMISATPMMEMDEYDQATAYYYIYTYGYDDQRMDLPMEYLADQAGMDITEFELFARVIEAESDIKDNVSDSSMYEDGTDSDDFFDDFFSDD